MNPIYRKPKMVAMATPFCLSMGYDFGGVIASDTCLIIGVGIQGQAIRRKYS